MPSENPVKVSEVTAIAFPEGEKAVLFPRPTGRVLGSLYRDPKPREEKAYTERQVFPVAKFGQKSGAWANATAFPEGLKATPSINPGPDDGSENLVPNPEEYQG
jgi:hypothetical protein